MLPITSTQVVLTLRSTENQFLLVTHASSEFGWYSLYSISSQDGNGPVKNTIAGALVQRILRAAQAGEKFKVVVVIPEVPGFAGNIKDENSVKIIMAAQYRTINRGGSSIYEKIREAGYEPWVQFLGMRMIHRLTYHVSVTLEWIISVSTIYEPMTVSMHPWVRKFVTLVLNQEFTTVFCRDIHIQDWRKQWG